MNNCPEKESIESRESLPLPSEVMEMKNGKILINRPVSEVEARAITDYLFRQYYNKFLGHALSWTKQPDDAEDILSISFRRLFCKLKKSDTLSYPFEIVSYLYRIINNQCINRWRRLQRSPLDLSGEELKNANGNTLLSTYSKDLHRTDENIEEAELISSVRKGVDELPPDFREPVILCDLEDHSYKEAAERTSTHIGTIMSRLYRGRKRLKKIFIRMAQADPDGPLGEIVPQETA